MCHVLQTLIIFLETKTHSGPAKIQDAGQVTQMIVQYEMSFISGRTTNVSTSLKGSLKTSYKTEYTQHSICELLSLIFTQMK